MLEPKRLKYRRVFRGKNRGKAQRGNTLDFGEFGIKAIDYGWVSAKEIESARKAIRGYVKRGGRLWIRIFPDKPITKKPPEVRMGSGKGPFDHYAAIVKPGKVIMEMTGVTIEIAKEALRRGAAKLSVPTKFINKEEMI